MERSKPMAELTFQELNLMQMLDVLRPGGIARLALARPM